MKEGTQLMVVPIERKSVATERNAQHLPTTPHVEWRHYFRSIIKAWQQADDDGNRCLDINFSTLAVMLEVTPPTIRNLWRGESVPRLPLCRKIALVFDRPLREVTAKAGIKLNNRYMSFDDMVAALHADTTLSPSECALLLPAIEVARHMHDPGTLELIDFVLNNDQPVRAKAEHLYSLIEGTRQMQQRRDATNGDMA